MSVLQRCHLRESWLYNSNKFSFKLWWRKLFKSKKCREFCRRDSLHAIAKSESLSFYQPFLLVQISTVCDSSTTINSTWWGTFDDLSLRILKSFWSGWPSLFFSADANRCCGKKLSLKRSFTSCSEAQVKPRGCPSLIWSSIRSIKGPVIDCNHKHGLMLTWHVHARPHCFILTEVCSPRLEMAYFAGKNV